MNKHALNCNYLHILNLTLHQTSEAQQMWKIISHKFHRAEKQTNNFMQELEFMAHTQIITRGYYTLQVERYYYSFNKDSKESVASTKLNINNLNEWNNIVENEKE